MTTKRRALISVTDKTGLEDFVRKLASLSFEILSTGGTSAALRAAGVEVVEVADFTGAPEMLGGRVKTLHPAIHAGILARKGNAEDERDLREHHLSSIDLVVVNLYRFEEAVAAFESEHSAAPGPLRLSDARIHLVLEQIDIGGPALVRAAAKNSPRVTVVVDPADYERVYQAYAGRDGPDEDLRASLAATAFRRIAQYDAAIDRFLTKYLQGENRTPTLSDDLLCWVDGCVPQEIERPVKIGEEMNLPFGGTLRYGENPHQRAFYVRGKDSSEAGVLHAQKLSGKQLSYNNLLDADSALALVRELDQPAAVIVKHNNPCGAAIAANLVEAFALAYAGDPLSAFGGIVAFNGGVDSELAKRVATRDHFFEVIIAPEFEAGAVSFLKSGVPWGPNVRLLRSKGSSHRRARWEVRSVVGGWLVQERDVEPAADWKVVSRRVPSAAELENLKLAWKVVKHLRSNAIALVHGGALVGAGAGQMSRVDSVEIAVRKAGERCRGAVLGSDAFFPFRDGPEAAVHAGVTAIVQPGGSKRDADIIQACDESEVALVFTGIRHFKH